jgi:hypothetical protein
MHTQPTVRVGLMISEERIKLVDWYDHRRMG